MKIKQLLIFYVLISAAQLEIAAQELSISSGFLKYSYYQDGENISKNDLTGLLKKDVVAWKHWERSNTYSTLSWIALASEAGFATWGIINKNPKNDTTANIGVYSSFAAVIAFSIISHVQKKKSVATYNQGLQTSNAFTIKPSKTGVGIVMQF